MALSLILTPKLTLTLILTLFNCFFAPQITVFTARSSCASAVLPLAIVILSVRPSVTRVLCDEIKEHTADILIPHERVITLVF